jgi:hypothetical protein
MAHGQIVVLDRAIAGDFKRQLASPRPDGEDAAL